jgi:hypothetical protein
MTPPDASAHRHVCDRWKSFSGGRRLSVGRSFARSFAKSFFNVCYVWVVSIVTIVVSAQKRAVHDAVAKTLALRGRPATEGSLETWRIMAAFGITFLWLVVTFLATL